MDRDGLMALAERSPWREGYEVTTDGRVFSRLSGEWRELKPVLHEGYGRVSIRVAPGSFKPFKIATIVCEVFHGPKPFDGAVVRHLDGDRQNDSRDNLAWGSVSDNALDAVAHGTNRGRENGRKGAAKLIGEQSQHAKLNWDKVRIIRKLRRKGWQLDQLAHEFNVTFSTISRICVGSSWPEPGMVVTKGIRVDRPANQGATQ